MLAEGNQPVKLPQACGKRMWPEDREGTTVPAEILSSDRTRSTHPFGLWLRCIWFMYLYVFIFVFPFLLQLIEL